MIQKELVIIGSGPAGLCAGEIAQELNIEYLIVEKGEIAQAWKTIRPNMQLLSPCHPQRDWTSLSSKYPIWKLNVNRPYCNAEEFVNYLDSFAKHFELNIITHNAVTDIKKNKNGFQLDTEKEIIECKVILIATGFFCNPYVPNIPGVRENSNVLHSHYYNGSEAFKQQRVIIVGGGNSAAEIAIELVGFSQVYLFTRKELMFFSKSKNLCHIRGVSESYLLELIQMELIRYKSNTTVEEVNGKFMKLNNGEKLEFNHLIFATGYRPKLDLFSMDEFKNESENKYPALKEYGESSLTKNLFFGGPLAQYKLANTFIHGFTKTIPETMQKIKQRLAIY
jgi:putative flavoprotein involved in K+ transport